MLVGLALSAPIRTCLILQLELYALDAGYRPDHGAETLLNRAGAGGSAAAPALLTNHRTGNRHDTVDHHHGKCIRRNIGRSSQGRFDPLLEQFVGHTRRTGAKC